MNRRQFLHATAATTASLALLPSLEALAATPKLSRAGLQLYSVRDDMKTDPAGTLRKLGEMGFTQVEAAGYSDGKFYGQTPQAFKQWLTDAGLSMPSGHTGFSSNHYDFDKKELKDDWKRAVEAQIAVGQKHLISPWIADPDRASLDNFRRFLEVLNKAGEYCNQQGIRFGYHNHAFEFDKLGGKMMYEVMLKETDAKNVGMQMDVGWFVFANQNPVSWINRYPGRFISTHLKDTAVTQKKSKEMKSVVLGKGLVNFKALLAKEKKAGFELHFVEIEDYVASPLEDVKACLQRAKAL